MKVQHCSEGWYVRYYHICGDLGIGSWLCDDINKPTKESLLLFICDCYLGPNNYFEKGG